MVFWLLCGFPDEETSGWDVSSYRGVNACAFLSGGVSDVCVAGAVG